MKIGEEVEGKFQGEPTLFISHDELVLALSKFGYFVEHHNVSHLYIMDHFNMMTAFDYEALARLINADASNKLRVTVETTVYPQDIPRYARIAYMLCVELAPQSLGFFGDSPEYFGKVFHSNDQVKFTQNMYVACAPVTSFVLTTPDKFTHDLEV